MLSQEIRKRTRERGITLSNLATLMGITRDTLQRRLRNTDGFRRKELKVLKEVLGLLETELLQ